MCSCQQIFFACHIHRQVMSSNMVHTRACAHHSRHDRCADRMTCTQPRSSRVQTQQARPQPSQQPPRQQAASDETHLADNADLAHSSLRSRQYRMTNSPAMQRMPDAVHKLRTLASSSSSSRRRASADRSRPDPSVRHSRCTCSHRPRHKHARPLTRR